MAHTREPLKLEMLREGGTLVVWKLDRLGRSVKQLVDLAGELHKHGVQFRSLTDSIDTGTPSSRFFFHVMASLAEMERELTVERIRAGLEVARFADPMSHTPRRLYMLRFQPTGVICKFIGRPRFLEN